MPFTDRALLESAALFAGMLLCLELGRRLGRRATAGEAEGANPGDRGGGRRPPTERPRDDGIGIVGAKFDVRHFDNAHRGHVHASAGNYFRDAFPPCAGLRLPRRPGMSRAKSRLWIHIIGFAAVASLTVYVILEIEYPRLGVIRVDAADKVLVDLRETMK
jgi:hypothetical protein